MLEDAKAKEWIAKFKSKYKRDPTNYSITAYNGVLVIGDAVERVAKGGKPVSRSTVRDAIQQTSLKNTLQGSIEYDENGDIKSKVVALYQVKDGKFKYVGIAPEK
jgi:branched-chain amino acid transport system substrate-binding protein